MQQLTLYRSIKEPAKNDQLIFKYRDTMRPPGNVPYVVDNLWEWARPEKFPCRRKTVYASPTTQLALKSGPEDGKVYRVKFLGRVNIAQVRGHSDSKEHRDCKELKKQLLNLLKRSTKDRWLDRDIDSKEQIGRLWMPCLRKNDIDYLFTHVQELKKIRSELLSWITYWRDVEIIHSKQMSIEKVGEIFFEAKEGYQLVSLT